VGTLATWKYLKTPLLLYNWRSSLFFLLGGVSPPGLSKSLLAIEVSIFYSKKSTPHKKPTTKSMKIAFKGTVKCRDATVSRYLKLCQNVKTTTPIT